MFSGFARGLALFLGCYTLLNLAGDLRFAGSDANLWWIDFTPLPLAVSRIVLVMLAAALIAWAVAPPPPGPRRSVTIALLAIAIVTAIANAARFYFLLGRGDIRTRLPIPLSMLVALALVFIAIAVMRPRAQHWPAFIFGFASAIVIFPMAQIALFGATDYRRPADLIVVFGAKAYGDGTASLTLGDRVRTGCELYRSGLAPRILMSGGPTEGPLDETVAMKRLAMKLGVPDGAILRDPDGVNTEATVRNTMRIIEGRPTRILAVSHFYHLPRIKMTFQRYGANVVTVPSGTSMRYHTLYSLPREDVAFWAYYLRRLR